jgi:beta-mannosidase
MRSTLVIVLFAALCASVAKSETLSLSGRTDWRIHDDADGKGVDRGMSQADVSAAGWIAATVPGNIQSDLEAAHHLNPLWYGAGDPRLYDVARKDWWYRKDFIVPADYNGKRLTLVFDGVDHECDVWLNGQKLGHNAGMFRRIELDATAAAKPGEVNRLAVRIAKMPDEIAPLLVNSDGAMSAGFVEAIIATRKALKELKSPTNFGWDWGVNIWTLGIWKNVRMEATGPARIAWTRVRTELSDNFRKATVRVNLEIHSQKEGNVRALFSIVGPAISGQIQKSFDVTLKPGMNHVEAELPLEHPALWWCNGHGAQPLYTLRVAIRPANGGAAFDERTTRFGVREVRWVHTQGAPKDFVSRYQLILNGRPVRTIGSCLIPPDLLFGRCGPKSLQLLDRALDAGMTIVRMWGGGVILPEEFYDRADELGIMLSQEMPLANSWPETDAVFLTNLETTVRNIIKQLRNHPSIIEWGGGNEMPWNSLTKHPALQVLQKVAAEEDDRLMRATCPDLGAEHSPWDFDVTGSYAHYNKARPMRYGEFGAQTPANLEVWQREIPVQSQWPIKINDPILIRKNVVQAVFSGEHWLLKSRIEKLFGSINNLPDLVRGGQFLGAEGLRYACDANRRAGAAMGGFTTWDFNEPWPNGAGSYMVDYDGRTLMNYDFFKQAVAPIALSLKYDSLLYEPKTGVRAELFLVSDAPQPVKNLRWKWLARDRRGHVFAQGNGKASISPIEVKSLGTISFQPPAKTAFGPVFVELRLEDAAGKILTERLHVFGPSGVADPLRGLIDNRLPDTDDDTAAKPTTRPVSRTKLRVTPARTRRDGDYEVLELAVKNAGTMTALFCEPHSQLVYRTDLFIANNNCFIPPGESRTITIRAPRRSQCGLTLEQTGWHVSCWNADDAIIAPSSDVLLWAGQWDKTFKALPGKNPVLTAGDEARFEFTGKGTGRARLRIHTADQSPEPAVVEVNVNGQTMEKTLPRGLGIQREEPHHLAFPATLEFDLNAAGLNAGKNILSVQIKNSGWFSWDAVELVYIER